MTSTIDLAALGISQEDLRERLIDRLCDRVLTDWLGDEDGSGYSRDSQFKRDLDAKIQQRVDETITALAEQHVLPRVAEYVETLTLQETTKWGEKRGEPVTFIEYLTRRADEYMREAVDYKGKTKQESGDYSWSKSGTRVAHMINAHLHYSIERAMQQALANANSSIKDGLESAVKIALENVAAKLKVQVNTK